MSVCLFSFFLFFVCLFVVVVFHFSWQNKTVLSANLKRGIVNYKRALQEEKAAIAKIFLQSTDLLQGKLQTSAKVGENFLLFRRIN